MAARRPNSPVKGYAWPAHFDRAACALFIERVAAGRESAVWSDDDIDVLERYVTATQVARLARARIAARAEGCVDPAEAYTSRGSQGQLVQHPDLKTARDAERDAQLYEDRLHARQAPRGGERGEGDQAGL